VAIFEQWGSSKWMSSPVEGVVMGEVSPEFTEVNRSRAKAVKERLERMGLAVTLGQAYEVVAAAHGHRNWPVMKSSAPAEVPHLASIRETVEASNRVGELISQFKDFIELRQKWFVPRNKALVFGGTGAERRTFADDIARELDLEVSLIGPGARVGEIDDAFRNSFRQRKLIFIDTVERLDVRTAVHLCACLEEMPPSQFVVMGAGASLDAVSLSLLRRVSFRHSLD
jgi:hypothetical protein